MVIFGYFAFSASQIAAYAAFLITELYLNMSEKSSDIRDCGLFFEKVMSDAG